MRPELFTLPFVHLSIKSYGFMMVVGFGLGVLLARHLCRRIGEDADRVTNFAIYALLAGVIGARGMHVLHNWSHFRDHPGEVFAIWSGGLEFLGGVIAALVVLLVQWRRGKLNAANALDILAPALMLGLAFGRVGCLLNGCCFGVPSDLPWAIRFPAVNSHACAAIGCERGGCQFPGSQEPGDQSPGNKQTSYYQYSYPYEYQLFGDPDHDRVGPLIELPVAYYGYTDGAGHWFDVQDGQQPVLGYFYALKPVTMLSEAQLADLKANRYPMHPIHPAQIYSSLNALLLCVILSILFRYRKRPGEVFCLMLILYGLTRLLLEMLRIEPVFFAGLTISQNLGIAAMVAGAVAFFVIRLRGRVIPAGQKGN